MTREGWLKCCEHCGCEGEREGHDDACAQGCNDRELIAEVL